jgi:hypothetical protein
LTASIPGRAATIAGLIALAALAGALSTATPVSAATTTLWDQYDNTATDYVNSQDLGPDYPSYDDFAADDFQVPTSEKWHVTRVSVAGLYDVGTGPAPSVNVYFWRNRHKLPEDDVYTAEVSTFSGGDTGSFVLPLPSAAKLKPGRTYWLTVQANMNFATYGKWSWFDRSVQTLRPAVWTNPGGGWNSGCLNWETRATCLAFGASYPDQVFRLEGRAIPIVP